MTARPVADPEVIFDDRLMASQEGRFEVWRMRAEFDRAALRQPRWRDGVLVRAFTAVPGASDVVARPGEPLLLRVRV